MNYSDRGELVCRGCLSKAEIRQGNQRAYVETMAEAKANRTAWFFSGRKVKWLFLLMSFPTVFGAAVLASLLPRSLQAVGFGVGALAAGALSLYVTWRIVFAFKKGTLFAERLEIEDRYRDRSK